MAETADMKKLRHCQPMYKLIRLGGHHVGHRPHSSFSFVRFFCSSVAFTPSSFHHQSTVSAAVCGHPHTLGCLQPDWSHYDAVICVWQVLQKDALLRTERQLFTYFFTATGRLRQTLADTESHLRATRLTWWLYFVICSILYDWREWSNNK